MLLNGASLKFISKVSGKSKEEIKTLQIEKKFGNKFFQTLLVYFIFLINKLFIS